MAQELTHAEDRYVENLLSWDRHRRRADGWLCLSLLVLGGLVVVIFAFLTLRSLTDRTALTMTVPGFVAGIALIVLYLQLEQRMQERRLIASVLRKLRGEG